MAERRMFSKSIIDSDLFLEMPITSQLLYFHLSMRADDDGFVDKPKSIMRLIGCKPDDLKILAVNKFVIPFESGIVVIRHWKVHNYIQKDRYKPTVYQEEKAHLAADNGNVYSLDTECIQLVSETDTQVRLGKDSLELGKSESEANNEPDGSSAPSKPIRHKYGEYKNVLLSDEELEKLRSEFPFDYNERIDRLSEYMRSTGKSYKDHLATIRSWARKDKEKQKSPEKPKSEFFNADILEVFADE